MCVQEDELSSAECLGYRSLQQRLCGDDGPLRDLSAWRVTIPRVSSHADPENPRQWRFTGEWPIPAIFGLGCAYTSPAGHLTVSFEWDHVSYSNLFEGDPDETMPDGSK